MINKLVLSIGLAILSCSAVAQQSNGAVKGQPFKDVQQILDAANDALAAAVSANTSNVEANSAAIAAEEAARIAEDAALLAKFAAEIAAEALARMEGDNSLADAMASEELARIADVDLLGTRIDDLGVGGGNSGGDDANFRELYYEDTDGYEVNVLRADLFDFNYQPGEWLYMATTFAGSGLRSAVCTSHANAYTALSTYALGGTYFASINGSMTYVLAEGSNTWANGFANMFIQPYELRATATQVNVHLLDRDAMSQSGTGEILTVSGHGDGNTAIFRAASSRLDACGF